MISYRQDSSHFAGRQFHKNLEILSNTKIDIVLFS